jgi:hypothetical protein
MGALPPGQPQPKKLLDRVRDMVRTKHYAYSTEQSYVQWIRRYILFHDTALFVLSGYGVQG